MKGEGYDNDDSLKKLGEYIKELENEKIKKESLKCKTKAANRLFYLATPPNVFGQLSEKIKKHLSHPIKKEEEEEEKIGWKRVIVEKPFGEDSESCEKLLAAMGEHLQESEIYRIDHYLAKEMVQNLLVLRFSNTLWDSLWDRRSIKCVKISIKETEGVEGRGGYYDEYGVIRDVFQNHLLQILCLLAMEAPAHLQADDIRTEKVKVLKAITTPQFRSSKGTIGGQANGSISQPPFFVVGQYGASVDGKLPSYLQDPSIKKLNPTSKQITFAQMVLFVQNRRWNGVPFICKCGKGLDNKNAEIRIQFKNDELSLYPDAVINELVIRLQPSEAIWLRLNTKTPGFARFQHTYPTYLDLTYQTRFGHHFALPAAYTRLLLDCMEGDQSLFVRDDELREAWRIVTPVLRFLQRPSFQPPIYPRFFYLFLCLFALVWLYFFCFVLCMGLI
ncbi:glucose-6-phosphate 1-dehydrogenase [Reticulomyxa filosa]|uniref:Glucose-6-phosphate 1-dehydrogenase n=1 Tax=Reticulomyxa filosa TaxID=46433 RepID=X6NBV0_RETFI|nr:glucose-6-phosphate 1-dehydrogenase [Reticulomyxa filosa]|eukprot:ETO23471.1 glucose-6-phosphate 1-dehydrogenase [Reticulomyxa filosa]